MSLPYVEEPPSPEMFSSVWGGSLFLASFWGCAPLLMPTRGVGLEVLFEFASSLEFYDLFCGDDNLLLGLGVAALTLTTYRYAESAKANKGYFPVVAVFEGFRCCLDESVESLLGVGFCQAGFLCDLVDQLCFVHFFLYQFSIVVLGVLVKTLSLL